MTTNGYHPEPVQEMPAWMREQDDPFIRQPAANPPAAQATEPALTPRFAPLSLSELLNLPPKEWIIENVIGQGDLCMIYGAPGCGKTFVVIDLIFAACLGQQFAMRFGVERPLNVAYTAGEGISGLPMRFQAAAAFYGVEQMPNFTFFANTPQLFAKEGAYASVTDFVTEWQGRQANGEAQPLDILIIDTLHSATAGADENSSQDMGIVLQAAKHAATTLGCAVILVHHTNKSGQAERGSSSLRGAMDCMIEIKRIGENSTKAGMYCEKLKDGEAWQEKIFDLTAIGDSVRIWWYEDSEATDGDKRKSETARHILQLLSDRNGVRLTAKQIGEATDTRPQIVNKVMARMEKNNLVIRDQNERGTWCFVITDEGKTALQNPNTTV
jgi:predicted transcriptional regulator